MVASELIILKGISGFLKNNIQKSMKYVEKHQKNQEKVAQGHRKAEIILTLFIITSILILFFDL